VLQLLEHEDPGTLAENEAVPRRIEGRLAVSGESLRSESAVMAAKPAIVIPVTLASVPPAIMTSASPCWIARNAFPMACAPDAHADTVA
jgi:hypothetical protein